MHRFLAISLSTFLLTALMFAQLVTNTSIVGNVADATGAAISEAQITARNQDTGEILTSTTGEPGTYEFQFLKPGMYTITVQKSGFSTVSEKDLAVSANQTARADFSLKVGSVDTSIEITADIPPIKTDDASVSELITTRSTAELPLNGRNPIRLAVITPGVIPGLKTPTGNPGGGEGYIGAGLREISNSVSLDGVSLMNNLITTTTYRPSVDAIQEVQVQ